MVHVLDEDSLVAKEFRYREHGSAALWNATDYQLADIKDLTSVTNFLLQNWMRMNSDNPNREIPPPVPAYRPGMDQVEAEKPAYKFADVNEMTEFFSQF